MGNRFFTEHVASPIGVTLVVTDEHDVLRALDWVDYEARMHRLLRLHYGKDGVRLEARSLASKACSALQAYFGGVISALDALAVGTGGTPFQNEVWAALRAVPAGTTTTYGQLAMRIGRAKAMRAVGMANGANPIGIVVPCHRVIGLSGALTGYGGGIERKRWLLEHEGVRVAAAGKPRVCQS